MTRTGNPFRPHTSLPSRPATRTACFPRSWLAMTLISVASLAVTGCGGGDSQPAAAATERPAVSSSPAPSSNTTASGNAASSSGGNGSVASGTAATTGSPSGTGNAGASGTSTGHDAHTGHEHTHISTQGRLALTEKAAAALYVFDLDRHTVEARHALPAAVSEVYASPGRRYAMAVQRPQGVVSFVDGGIWQEDHGDHLHDYRQGFTLLTWQLQGVNPTHVNETAQGTTAIFMDGTSSATPQVNAAVQVVSDASIAAGKAAGSVSLDTPMHGMAQPLGDVMLTVKRSKPATASDVMPDHLQVLTRQGEHYQPQQVIDTVCGTRWRYDGQLHAGRLRLWRPAGTTRRQQGNGTSGGDGIPRVQRADAQGVAGAFSGDQQPGDTGHHALHDSGCSHSKGGNGQAGRLARGTRAPCHDAGPRWPAAGTG